MKADRRLIESAREIIENGSAKVHKTTRSGFTTSCVIAAQEMGLNILIISPTKRILDETVRESSEGRSISIPSNSMCLKIQEEMQGDKFLSQIPQALPSSCDDCERFQNCPVTDIFRAFMSATNIKPEREYDRCLIAEESSTTSKVINITYSKLVALMLSKARIAKRILRKLSCMDIIMLDEAHTIALPAVVTVKAFTEVVIPDGHPNLSTVHLMWLDFNKMKEEEIKKLEEEGNIGHVGRHLSTTVYMEDALGFKQLVAAWHELFNLAKRRKELEIDDSQILVLRDIISLMSSHVLALTYRKETKDEVGYVCFAGNYWIANRALGEFLTTYAAHANHLYVSGTLVEPHPNYYSELSGKKVKDVVFPDIRNTNAMMKVNPDKWRLDSHNFLEKLEEIGDRIVEICKQHGYKKVYVLAPNAKKAKVIERLIAKRLGSKTPYIDYYRSDHTIGVSREERICVAIGLADVPSNTYDHMARGNSPDEKWIDSQRLRQESTHAATMQAWSRVKDPEGKEESIVYCIGIRAKQIGGIVSWGPGREQELIKIRDWSTPDEVNGKTPIFRVTVKDLIEPPRVGAELRTSSRRDRHNVGEYVEGVEKYNDDLIISDFVDKVPIINNRENVHQSGIYNNPANNEEQMVTARSLVSLFAARFDCYAKQNSTPDEQGRYGYSKRLVNVCENPYIMKNHVKGQYTVGFYQIGLDDTVKWICFDIDDHKGERGPNAVREDLHRLFEIFTKYEIPFLLESSGSPNSYHIWILLKPTKTYNAYNFARQIAAKAVVECEIFPKNKSLNKDAKYGNLVKVPLGINRKTGIKSQFLDPSTFEPFSDIIPIQGIVRLRELQKQEELHAKSSKRKINRINSKRNISKRTPTKIGLDMRPCFTRVLEAKIPLEGSEGHEMRIAIAAEAWNIGYPIEKTIELFRDQPDFNPDISRKQIDYIYDKGYYPYECITLREKCSSIVSSYCSECPFYKAPAS